MSKKQMTLVYYYVPEDQDDPQYPNVFGVMVKKDSIRLNHIIQNFPLSGTYLFRFKAIYDNATVWLDFNDLNRQVPLLKNKVYVKATRISWETQNSLNYLRQRRMAEISQLSQKYIPESIKSQKHTSKEHKTQKHQKKVSQSLLDIKHTKQDANHDLLNHQQPHDNLLNSNNNSASLFDTHSHDINFSTSNFVSANLPPQSTNQSNNIFDHFQSLNIGSNPVSSNKLPESNLLNINNSEHKGGDSLL